jgi:DNA gyrase/topoisomerase IV subunit B
MGYDSKSIRSLEGVEAIRLRPGMYIGDTDVDGMHHLLLEIISNSIDEALNGYGKEITIEIKEDEAIITDFGRGIPFGETEDGEEAIIELATKLHSGGKFNQGAYSVSGGLHGIGASAVNALSSYFSITSIRDDMVCDVSFCQGQLMEIQKTNQKTIKTSSIVSFTPDPEIFKDIVWDKDRIAAKIELLSFLTSGVTFNFIWNGEKKTYLSKNGLKDLIESKAQNKITSVIGFRQEKDNFDVEVAFAYVEDSSEKIYAFTNNIPNADGGTHVTGFKTGLTTAFNKLARSLELLTEKDENLSGDHIRGGLVAAINIKMRQSPQFTNQTKDKLTTPEARGAASNAVTTLLEKSISKNDIKAIFDRAMIEKKAEDAAKRSKEAAAKVTKGGKNLNTIKDLPAKLADCTDRSGELFLCEGDSAGGGAAISRNTRTQAILPLRGKVLNTFNKELADIIHNKEVMAIFTALGCGVGENFNIANMRYDKVILMADADPDGGHITTLLIALFLRHLPELIKSGRIYAAMPPLYKIKGKKETLYAYDEKELKKLAKKTDEITRFKGLGEMGATELYQTTMNPETRRLIQLTTENLDETMKLFETLMGSSSILRRAYILSKPLNKLDADDVFDDTLAEGDE